MNSHIYYSERSSNITKGLTKETHPFSLLIYNYGKFPASFLLRSCVFILMFYCLVSTLIEDYFNFIYISYWTLLFVLFYLVLIITIEICSITGNKKLVINNPLFEYIYKSVMLYCFLVSLLMLVAFYSFIRSRLYPTYKDRIHFVVTNEIVHFVLFAYMLTEFLIQRIKFEFKDLFLSTVIGNIYISTHILVRLYFDGMIYPGILDFQQNAYASFLLFIGIYIFEVILGIGVVILNDTLKIVSK